jgi:hypothetical protein
MGKSWELTWKMSFVALQIDISRAHRHASKAPFWLCLPFSILPARPFLTLLGSLERLQKAKNMKIKVATTWKQGQNQRETPPKAITLKAKTSKHIP